MRTSPIHLKSSKQAKLRASRSKSAHHQETSTLMNQKSRLNQSIHTIKVKLSPNKLIESQTYSREHKPLRPQSFINFTTNTVRPVENRSPFRTMNPLTNSKGSKSFYQLPKPHGIIVHHQVKRLSHQKQNSRSSPFHQDMSQSINNNSPIKAIQQNDRSFIKVVELGKMRSPPKIVHPPIRMTSPPKILNQVVYKTSPKQIQLQRKVKILQIRIGQLHNEKNLSETKMNQMNIRLQYQNNFLRQKLNKFPSNKNIRPFNNLECMIKTVSSEEIKEIQDTETKVLHASCPQKNEANLIQVTPKLTEKLSKSSDNFFQKSKQIQSIKQQLLQTEEMLSKQIEKSLKLLQQLSLKQKENEQLKNQNKALISKLQQNDEKYLLFQSENKKLQENLASLQARFKEITVQVLEKDSYISDLQQKVNDFNQRSNENMVPKELYDQIEQNNQILMSAMSSLQNSVNESQNQISTLTIQKQQLQQEINKIQTQLQEKRSKLEQKQEGNEFWKQKVNENQFQIRDSHSKLETFQLLIEEKNSEIEQRERQLLQKQLFIQNLQIKIEQLESNIPQSQSGCRNPQRTVCAKCGELRRTVIRLNSYLNNCSSQFSRDSK